MEMQIEVTVGPVPPGVEVPRFGGLSRILRPARSGEATVREPCPRCRRRRLRDPSTTCRSCGGTGMVQGVPLLRLTAPPSSGSATTLLAWAHENEIRTDVRLSVQATRGTDWSMGWTTPNGSMATTPNRPLVGHRLVAAMIERGRQIEGHVAIHEARPDGSVQVAGLWDLVIEAGRGRAFWSSRRSPQRVRAHGVRFPRELLASLKSEIRAQSDLEHRPDDVPFEDDGPLPVGVPMFGSPENLVAASPA
jgi:hypothetical protein